MHDCYFPEPLYTKGSLDTVATGPLVNGHFEIQEEAKDIRMVEIRLYPDADSKGEIFYAVFEPGATRLKCVAQLKGDYYSNLIINSWLGTPEYKEIYE